MQQLKPFAACIEAQAKVANTGNYETPGQEFVSLDNDFHQLLYHYGGYDRAWQAVHNVTSHYDRVRYMTNAVIRQDENRVVEEHRRFYNYLMLGIPPTVDPRFLSSSEAKAETRICQWIAFNISVNAVNLPRKSAFDSVKKADFCALCSIFVENIRFERICVFY